MAEKSCVRRLQKEYRALCKEPVSHVVARPSPSDILEWRKFSVGPSYLSSHSTFVHPCVCLCLCFLCSDQGFSILLFLVLQK
uniref:UBC core domain-containing protein n=1 Tax=Rhizophora mucronata TaxID=61149 RepID=A0A2P2L903_RHIMU